LSTSAKVRSCQLTGIASHWFNPVAGYSLLGCLGLYHRRFLTSDRIQSVSILRPSDNGQSASPQQQFGSGGSRADDAAAKSISQDARSMRLFLSTSMVRAATTFDLASFFSPETVVLFCYFRRAFCTMLRSRSNSPLTPTVSNAPHLSLRALSLFQNAWSAHPKQYLVSPLEFDSAFDSNVNAIVTHLSIVCFFIPEDDLVRLAIESSFLYALTTKGLEVYSLWTNNALSNMLSLPTLLW
jgi:hypothetical protein